jgi:hypothetical protein
MYITNTLLHSHHGQIELTELEQAIVLVTHALSFIQTGALHLHLSNSTYHYS